MHEKMLKFETNDYILSIRATKTQQSNDPTRTQNIELIRRRRRRRRRKGFNTCVLIRWVYVQQRVGVTSN